MNNPELDQSPETITEDTTTLSLILFNDDHNSFLTVILALQDVLGWTPQQSEQAASIAHHKGKYCLKSGSYVELEKYKYGLEDRGLSVEIA